MFNLTLIEIIYWIATIVGGTFFILRSIMMVIGGGFGDMHTDGDIGGDIDADFDADIDADFDADLDGGTDAHVDTHMHADTDTDHGAYASFRFLSLQSLTAFIMIFGLSGLALFHSDLPVVVTFIGSLFFGFAAAWALIWMLNQLMTLQSDGTLNIENAVGEKGSVYLTIPAKSSGQVQITIQGALKIYDAIAADGKKIPTGEKIRVTGVENNRTLIVEKV